MNTKRALVVAVVAVVAALAVADVAAGSLDATGVAAGSVALQRVPVRMDASNQSSWWTPLALNRSHAYLAFNGHVDGPEHTVKITRHSLRTGRWRTACLPLPAKARCARYPDNIGHHQPTIAIDGSGTIHAFAAMHHSRWRYWRSDEPRRVETMRFRGRDLGRKPGRFTYPVAATGPNGDVWLIVRQSGVSPVLGRLYRWDLAARRWSSLGAFAAAEGRGVYPDDLEVDADGRVHILWSWSGGLAGGVRHAASYMVYDPATGGYANAAGEPVAAPATPESAVVFQPLEPGEEWSHVMSGFGLRGAALALRPGTSRPVVAYRYQAPEDGSTEVVVDGARVRLAEWNGSGWERRVVHEAPTSAALGITVHGGDVRVYYDGRTVYRDQPVMPIGDVDWPVSGGSLSVVQHGGADYVYRAVPRARALYLGRVGG